MSFTRLLLLLHQATIYYYFFFLLVARRHTNNRQSDGMYGCPLPTRFLYGTGPFESNPSDTRIEHTKCPVITRAYINVSYIVRKCSHIRSEQPMQTKLRDPYNRRKNGTSSVVRNYSKQQNYLKNLS